MASSLPRVVSRPSHRHLAPLSRADRAAGRALRAAGLRAPAAAAGARTAAAVLSPAFRGAVALMVLAPPTRGTGLRALAAGVAAGLAARALRDRIGRSRPGARSEGGFPSRHAAASVAIARAVSRGGGAVAPAFWGAAAVGLAGRVITADHDPADIAAGAIIGLVAERAVAALAPGQVA